MSQESQNKIVNRCLWVYTLLLVAMTALSWTVYFASGRFALFRPLFDYNDRFRDLTNYSDKMAHLADVFEEIEHPRVKMLAD